MNENTRLIIQALFWVVMAAAIVALLLLPIPHSSSTDNLIDNQPTYPSIPLDLDLTFTSIDGSCQD